MSGFRVLVGVLGLAVLAYCGVAAVLFLAQRRIVFRPDPTRPELAAAVPGLQATFLHDGNGLALLAWWLPPPSKDRPTVLYLHGNGGNLANRAGRLRTLAAAGFGVLMPEYPGYGGNPGSPSERSLFATADAAADFLRERGIAGRAIVAYGESLGTAVATWVAARQQLRALVLESPFTSVTALAQQQYWFLPVGWLVRDPFDTLGRISQIDAPLLVAIGERDRVVPPEMGRAIFAAAPEPKRLWGAADGGHEDLAAFGLMAEVIRFLDVL